MSVVLLQKHGISEAVQQNWFGIKKPAGIRKGRDVHVPPSLKLLFPSQAVLLLFLSLPSIRLKILVMTSKDIDKLGRHEPIRAVRFKDTKQQGETYLKQHSQ